MDETRHNEQGLTLAPGGAALPDATDPTAVGSAQTVIISPHHPAASGLRFGITGKLMLGLAILAVLTIATAGFALYSILGFSGQFAHVADRQVPGLIAATRLSQQSESIVAAAPALINATDQVARQSARLTLNDHFDWLTEVIG